MTSIHTQTCFSCDYDLSGINPASTTCPECGQSLSPPYRSDISAERVRRSNADRKIIICMCIFLSPILLLHPLNPTSYLTHSLGHTVYSSPCPTHPTNHSVQNVPTTFPGFLKLEQQQPAQSVAPNRPTKPRLNPRHDGTRSGGTSSCYW